jgi:transposase
MAYSQETRVKVLAAVDAGYEQADVAAMHQVSLRYVNGLVTKRRRGESLELGRSPGRPRKLSDVQVAQVVKARPDATLADFRRRLGREDVALMTVWRAVRRVGLTHKKSR